LFYLQSRGISYTTAIALLLQGFAMEILDKIPSDSIRNYVKDLIAQRLNVEL